MKEAAAAPTAQPQAPALASGALRVLHAPSIVGANPPGLAQAERALGLKSWCVAHYEARGYQADEVLCASVASPWGMAQAEWARWPLLRRARRDFDVVHFNAGKSIAPGKIMVNAGRLPAWLQGLYNAYAGPLELKDLPGLRRAGKALVMTFQGDDARQADATRSRGGIHFADAVEPGYYPPWTDAHKRWRIAEMARWVDLFLSVNPDLLEVLPAGARFMPYGHVHLDQWEAAPPTLGPSDRPVVVHAPTHRKVKGTAHVLAALEGLKAGGLDFELVLVENMSWAEARAAYARADLVVDQLLAGWYGGLAVEAMALGKPVACFLREADFVHLQPQMAADLPFIQATPASIEAVLAEWLGPRKTELGALGRRSRAYVERWHDPLAIAADLKACYGAILAKRPLPEAFRTLGPAKQGPAWAPTQP